MILACPACQWKLEIPAQTRDGQKGRCSGCGTGFYLKLDRSGNTSPKLQRSLPPMLFGPALGLLILGICGMAVNGYLALLFLLKPGADFEYSRNQLVQLRTIQAGSLGKKPELDDNPYAFITFGAITGPSAALMDGPLQEVVETPLAKVWAARMLPLQATFTLVSAVVLLGGLLILRGQGYYFIFLCCFAAMLNFNHLCCIPGAIVGIWGIVMLARDDMRPYFQR